MEFSLGFDAMKLVESWPKRVNLVDQLEGSKECKIIDENIMFQYIQHLLLCHQPSLSCSSHRGIRIL